jgi:hypothetical protein
VSKKISESDIIGQTGINFIEGIVLGMGFLWYPTGGVEAGIDGFIEIRDRDTGIVTNSIIQVQSKATQRSFQAETETSFEFLCKEKDIEYWLNGNAPVILIIIQTITKNAFWVSVKDYFQDPKIRKTRKIIFDKTRHRFDVSAKSALIELAIPRSSGLYLSPPPKQETIYSNLLRVDSFGEQLYTAHTITGDEAKAHSALQKIGRELGQEWILKENWVLSFHNLRQSPWSSVCDIGTVEKHQVEEWSLSEKFERRQEFVWLLNKALREKVKEDLSFDPKKEIHYFKPTQDRSIRTYHYRSLAKKTHRDVFSPYSKKDSKDVAHYRHSAFSGQFLRIESDWFLEITPTYFFSQEGFTRDKFERDKLSGIKKLEKNSAVLGQLIMWAEYLASPEQGDLFITSYSLLKFGQLEEFEVDVGIDEVGWLKSEDDELNSLEDPFNELPLFQLKNED